MKKYQFSATVKEIATAIYSLQFPNRDFEKLPEHVQEAYMRDAKRFLKWFVNDDTLE